MIGRGGSRCLPSCGDAMTRIFWMVAVFTAMVACRGDLGDSCSAADGCREGLWCERGACVSRYAELTCAERCRRFAELRAAVGADKVSGEAGRPRDLDACLAGCGERGPGD